MNRDLKFICCQPDDTYYIWQVQLWIESLKALNQSEKAIVLVYTPKDRKVRNSKWDKLVELYPEVEFAFYNDDHDVHPKLALYIPILRPYTLWRYFSEHPEMSEKAIFYCDCDVLFLENFNIDSLIQDDINYLSDTNSYINASYFDNKVRDVKPDKLEEYKKLDVLSECSALVGVTRETCVANNQHSGGAQYLLKNIDADFWKKVMDNTLLIRSYLMSINRTYFASESKGFQSWCADMWGVLWNIWYKGGETKVIPELNFAWATDPIGRLQSTTIFHNAGVGADNQGGHPCFYKGKYHQGMNPFTDPHLDAILNNEESKKWCTWYYASKLDKIRELNIKN